MSFPIVPASKIGTPFQSPRWRYDAIFNPEKFGFEKYCSKLDNANAGNFARLTSNSIAPVETFNLPIYIRQLSTKLTDDLYRQLLKVWTKHYYKTRAKKITFNITTRSGLLNWNMKKIEGINDQFFIKLIKYCYGLEGNEYITDCIKFYKNNSNVIPCKWLNYSFYYGKSDKELAITWKKPVKFIEALRLIFFDYSGWPKDKLVQYSLIRQTYNNHEIDIQDYHAFRRIFDLGDIGLRSILGHQLLTDEECDLVKAYLAGAGVDNLMDQRFAITNLKESISFNRSVAEYATIGLRRLEIEQKTAIMRLTAQNMQRDMGIDENNTQVQDTALLDYMRVMTEKDNPKKFPSYIDIQVEEEPAKHKNL